MCTYSRSRASKEMSETHHMYLLMVTCNKINELTCSICNTLDGPIIIAENAANGHEWAQWFYQ